MSAMQMIYLLGAWGGIGSAVALMVAGALALSKDHPTPPRRDPDADGEE